MASKQYNEWTIISRPKYISVEDHWYVYAVILRRLSATFESHSRCHQNRFTRKRKQRRQIFSWLNFG